jgi:hypothetical protein
MFRLRQKVLFARAKRVPARLAVVGLAFALAGCAAQSTASMLEPQALAQAGSGSVLDDRDARTLPTAAIRILSDDPHATSSLNFGQSRAAGLSQEEADAIVLEAIAIHEARHP